MAGFGRYELLDTIATGDFATVYRARDRELGREIAIKQIHPQFLHDEKQLTRYWQEAQLLASLQHPHVLTIYDIVRPRGWLILELMRGSLKQAAEVGPLDLDFLRVTLVCALSALHFLHSNGVVHGDIKPSNLMIDAQNRVKLGDFGLARRATSDEGSLLKGTTKYMAPELLSNQFGAVGPASDLYSLGFTAYELMCGPEFESLFPGLASFGRDKQIAWMMWHAAPDRSLPEITRMLQGVPPDLARVIQRLVVKDQARRYHSAREAIEDLRADRLGVTPPQAPPASAAPPSRRRRLLLAGSAFLVSLAAVLGILFWGSGRQAKGPLGPPPITHGVVREVYPDERRFSLESDDGRAIEVKVKTSDPIFINGKSQLLYDLRRGDHVAVRTLFDPIGRAITEIQATREEIARGVLTKVSPEVGRVVVKFGEGEHRGKEQAIDVPTTLRILFNGGEVLENRPVRLADLRPGDRAEIAHVGEEGGRKAIRLSAERVVAFRGVLRKSDPDRGRMTFSIGSGDPAQEITLPVAENCEVTLNNQRNVQERIVQATDLAAGDEVDVQHDTKIVRLDAWRVFRVAGALQKIDSASRVLEVLPQGRPAASNYLAPQKCTVELSGAPAGLDDLRVGDALEIAFDTPDARVPEAKSIVARRPADPRRFALILVGEKYEDASLTPLTHSAADAATFHDVLVKRYRTPEDQVLVLSSESLVRMEQGIPRFLARAVPESKLIVYVTAQAYRDDDGQVYIAPANFDFRRMSVTGMRLQWLMDQLEQCPAGEKLLLLDACHMGDGADLRSQPSTSEMIRTIKPPSPGLAPLRTVTAISSCGPGQRGLVLADGKTGLFVSCLAAGYSGAADKNRDTHVEPTELLTYLQATMPASAKLLGKDQTPELFLPDARPPRLTEDARKAIRALAAFLRQSKFDKDKVDLQYVTAEQLAGKEVEPKLLYGVLLLKGKMRDEAARKFDEINLERPGNLTAGQGIAWLHFERSACQAGIDALSEMVGQIKPPKNAPDAIPDDLRRVFFWAGQLREFAVSAAQEGRRAPESSGARLDAAVARQGMEAQRYYEQGRAQSRTVMADFDKQVTGASDDAVAARVRVQRRLLAKYAVFPFEEAAQRILAGLDQ